MSNDAPIYKTFPNGDKEWYLNGVHHREDGPAIERANGDKAWYLNGVRHREDGPAIEMTNGMKLWYLNGELHREDGPATTHVSGAMAYWFLNDEKTTALEVFKLASDDQRNHMLCFYPNEFSA
jgi:hypothetical protein